MRRIVVFPGLLTVTTALVIGCGGTPSFGEPDDTGVDTSSDVTGDVADTGDSSPSEDGSAVVTPAEACAALIDAYCTQIGTCAPFYLTLAYGDVATCKSREVLACMKTFGAPGTSVTPPSMVTCSKDLKAATCIDLLSSKLPASCNPRPGKLASDAACGEHAQCVRTFCSKKPGDVCGVCAALPNAGASCGASEECGPGMICSLSGTCAPPRSETQSCNDSTQPCAVTLSCTKGHCVKAAKAGEKCSGDGVAFPICDELKGLRCLGVTCQVIKTATPDNKCGFVGTDFVMCASRGRCKYTDGYSGTCLAAAEDGAMCNTSDGPDCRPPAVCDAGLCTIPDPASCK